jgi:SAM-dependent methyltransferase
MIDQLVLTEQPHNLFPRIAAAYVRGRLAGSPEALALPGLFEVALDQLDPLEYEQLIALGMRAGLRLHRFKHTMGLLRVAKILGALRGIAPAEVLDIGSGRGAFLWPLLDALPFLPVTALDVLAHRVADIQTVAAGGVAGLTAIHGDATKLPFANRHFDVVTMLEVLEHIPDTNAALHEIMRVARRFVLLSVPSHADQNPEHIHLFDSAQLEQLLLQHGATRGTFEYVPGHILVIARVV